MPVDMMFLFLCVSCVHGHVANLDLVVQELQSENMILKKHLELAMKKNKALRAKIDALTPGGVERSHALPGGPEERRATRAHLRRLVENLQDLDKHWCEQIGAASDGQQFAIEARRISQALQPPPGAASGEALASLEAQALEAFCRARDRRLMPPPPARWTLGQLEAKVTEVNEQFTLLNPGCSVDHNALWEDFCRLDPDPADGFWSELFNTETDQAADRLIERFCPNMSGDELTVGQLLDAIMDDT